MPNIFKFAVCCLDFYYKLYWLFQLLYFITIFFIIKANTVNYFRNLLTCNITWTWQYTCSEYPTLFLTTIYTFIIFKHISKTWDNVSFDFFHSDIILYKLTETLWYKVNKWKWQALSQIINLCLLAAI